MDSKSEANMDSDRREIQKLSNKLDELSNGVYKILKEAILKQQQSRKYGNKKVL